jgi:hypothetical protein
MVADLGLALFFVSGGGQISVMVTECVQGMIALFAYIAIAVAAMLLIPWKHAVAAMNTAPTDASMLNPFHTAGVQDFNAWFYLIGIFLSTYGFQTWLGAQGFMTSARNPHEQRMGNLISVWRRAPLHLVAIVLPLAAFTVMHLPQYAGLAAGINTDIHRISSTTLQNEMSVPIALAHILPVGIKGLLAMVVIFLSITCHDTYMHSWGAIFVQDVLIPWRGGQALEPEQHVRWLRYSIFFVFVLPGDYRHDLARRRGRGHDRRSLQPLWNDGGRLRRDDRRRGAGHRRIEPPSVLARPLWGQVPNQRPVDVAVLQRHRDRALHRHLTDHGRRAAAVQLGKDAASGRLRRRSARA